MDQTTLALSVTTGVLCLFWTGVRAARLVRSNARNAGEAAALTGGLRGAATLAALFVTTAAPAFLVLWLAKKPTPPRQLTSYRWQNRL